MGAKQQVAKRRVRWRRAAAVIKAGGQNHNEEYDQTMFWWILDPSLPILALLVFWHSVATVGKKRGFWPETRTPWKCGNAS